MAKSGAKSAIKKSEASHSKKGIPIKPRPTKSAGGVINARKRSRNV